MPGQQRARDGQDRLVAPGMGGLGRQTEAFFPKFSTYYSTIVQIIARIERDCPLIKINDKSG